MSAPANTPADTSTDTPVDSLPFFTHRSCAHFPCHEGIDPDWFNCLFCFCPLYALGPRCGGRFTYTADGIKDCSRCTLPHEGTQGNTLVEKHWEELSQKAGTDKANAGT